jgi:RNA polymerase sigma-70 factor (ECF subfamily)
LFFRTDKQRGRTGPSDAVTLDGVATGNPSEASLVEALRSFNETAWAEVYGRHAQQVYQYIYYRLGDPHTAEDLAADVFVKALAGIGGYQYRGTPLLAWLYRIAHNVTADYRKAAVRRSQLQAAESAEEIEERQDALQAFADRRDMMGAIRALTEDQQQVVILRFYQGMSNAEVSQVMGKPEGAVKALQTRALRSLRRSLTTGDAELGKASA